MQEILDFRKKSDFFGEKENFTTTDDLKYTILTYKQFNYLLFELKVLLTKYLFGFLIENIENLVKRYTKQAQDEISFEVGLQLGIKGFDNKGNNLQTSPCFFLN